LFDKHLIAPFERLLGAEAKRIGVDGGELRAAVGAYASLKHHTESADAWLRGKYADLSEAEDKLDSIHHALIDQHPEGDKRIELEHTRIQLEKELAGAKQETAKSEAALNSPGKAEVPLPLGLSRPDADVMRTQLEMQYGRETLDTLAKELTDRIQLAMEEGHRHGIFDSGFIDKLKELGYTDYVPAYTDQSEEVDTSMFHPEPDVRGKSDYQVFRRAREGSMTPALDGITNAYSLMEHIARDIGQQKVRAAVQEHYEGGRGPPPGVERYPDNRTWKPQCRTIRQSISRAGFLVKPPRSRAFMLPPTL
jgi:hypothetical protein